MEYAVSRMKMPHVRDCAISVSASEIIFGQKCMQIIKKKKKKISENTWIILKLDTHAILSLRTLSSREEIGGKQQENNLTTSIKWKMGCRLTVAKCLMYEIYPQIQNF